MKEKKEKKSNRRYGFTADEKEVNETAYISDTESLNFNDLVFTEGCILSNISIAPTYIWKPKEDITAYELAIILPYITNWQSEPSFGTFLSLNPSIERHFEKDI